MRYGCSLPYFGMSDAFLPTGSAWIIKFKRNNGNIFSTIVFHNDALRIIIIIIIILSQNRDILKNTIHFLFQSIIIYKHELGPCVLKTNVIKNGRPRGQIKN